jgi:hypothetical protein
MYKVTLAVLVILILLLPYHSFAECYSYINESGKRVYVGHVLKLPKNIDRQGKYQSCDNEIIINGCINKEIFLSINPDLTNKSIILMNKWAKAGMLTSDMEIGLMNNENIEKMRLIYEKMGATDKFLDEQIAANPPCP